MIRILNIGMNHETAPVELRECLASEPGQELRALNAMQAIEEVREAFFLSTCNRVEALYLSEDPKEAKNSILSLMSRLSGIPDQRFLPSLFTFEDKDAVRHIFRVASSLDS